MAHDIYPANPYGFIYSIKIDITSLFRDIPAKVHMNFYLQSKEDIWVSLINVLLSKFFANDRFTSRISF